MQGVATRQTRPELIPPPEPDTMTIRLHRTTQTRYNINKLSSKYNKLYFGNSIHGFTVEYGRNLEKTSGFTDPDNKIIEISYELHRAYHELGPELEELTNTLLHEMMHAWIFIHGTPHDSDVNDHCETWRSKVYEINQKRGHNITPYHDEIKDGIAESLRIYKYKCALCG